MHKEHTWLLQANNVRHIRHEDSTFQLKARLPLNRGCRLILAAYNLCLRLIRQDLFTTDEDSFEEVNMVLIGREGACPVQVSRQFPIDCQKKDSGTAGSPQTSLSDSLPVSLFTMVNVPKRIRSPNLSTLRVPQSSTRSVRSWTALPRCSLSIASFAASKTYWMVSMARDMSAWRSRFSVCLESSWGRSQYYPIATTAESSP